MITATPVVYIVKELGLKMSDWSVLDTETKERLKEMAAEEIAFINANS